MKVAGLIVPPGASGSRVRGCSMGNIAEGAGLTIADGSRGGGGQDGASQPGGDWTVSQRAGFASLLLELTPF